MASSAAALLDELMGRNRNANPNDEGGNIKWDNAEVKFLIIFLLN